MGRRKKTTEEFIKDARVVHGDRYNYSLVSYIRSSVKVSIICKEHGEFPQTPNSHLKGKGCPKCSVSSKKTTEEFIADAKAVHGDKYDYSKVVYVKSVDKVLIICKEHGEFPQTANSHLKGTGCQKCFGNVKKTTEEFTVDAKAVHGDKYDYNLVKYKNNSENVVIICKYHGEFPQTPASHLSGSGCSKCAKYGFDPSKPAIFYVYSFAHYAAFGITNDFKKRHVTHLKNFKKKCIDANLVATYNMTGILAQSLEKYIKQTLQIINTGIDGFKTEAVHINDLPILLDTIKQYESI